ncbi:hypothetical protein SteCoe_9954 [Stentor coeruleus]|uniref:Uncharacterized protein n=1 Tax=Stentor coeruleus TaxID=5963 RepID=A0A1R2CGI5_9CILI|nr:hypothetical protein SteCoe_9954 [Stentor coeruleus]
MVFSWLYRRFSCQEGERLARLLKDYKDRLDKDNIFKQDLLMDFIGNNIVVKEKTLSEDIKLKLTLNNKKFVVTFKAWKYERTDQVHEIIAENIFPFQVSYNVRHEACLFECIGAGDRFIVLRTSRLKYPIKVKRYSIEATDSLYRGPWINILSFKTRKLLAKNLMEMGITNEFIGNCIELARDKYKRLNSTWADKIHNFLNN